jgi:murein DD-endopeptidase MepM/ murein hydrolase activator NlpD
MFLNFLRLNRQGKKREPHLAMTSQNRSRKIFTLILIPEETAKPTRIQFPQKILFSVAITLVAVFAGTAALSIRYFQIRGSLSELATLRKDFDSIRDEATALYSQLLDVQSSLDQVDSYSSQVREATKLEDDRTPNATRRTPALGPRDRNTTARPGPLGFMDRLNRLPEPIHDRSGLNIPAADGGIGPISRDEFDTLLKSGNQPQNLEVAGRVNPNSLAFGAVFSELNNIKDQSSQQIDALTKLLTEVHQYRIKIDQTPTLAPVEGRLTSPFGFRASPITRGVSMHHGLDIAAPLGSPIRAAAAGVVAKVGRASDYGKFVQLKHGHNVVTVYAHAQQIFVRVGDTVHKGQKIATVGMTGRTTGPHLHFEVRLGNKRVNPSKYISFSRPSP